MAEEDGDDSAMAEEDGDDSAMAEEDHSDPAAIAERACDTGSSAVTESVWPIVAPSAENDLAFSQSIVDGVDCLAGVSEVATSPGTFHR